MLTTNINGLSNNILKEIPMKQKILATLHHVASPGNQRMFGIFVESHKLVTAVRSSEILQNFNNVQKTYILIY